MSAKSELANKLGIGTTFDADMLAGAAIRHIAELEAENARLRQGLIRIADAHSTMTAAVKADLGTD